MWGEQMNEVERISKKPYPWARIDDYNPDHAPSTSPLYHEAMGDDVLGVLAVKGLGVVVLRATPDYRDADGKLMFHGVSEFTKGEIGYTEKL